MPRGDRPLGHIATRLLFENERVKIWNLILEPGEAQAWHWHERDYVTVAFEGGDLTAEFEDSSTSVLPFEGRRWRYFGEPHRVHRVINHSVNRFRNVLIELKD